MAIKVTLVEDDPHYHETVRKYLEHNSGITFEKVYSNPEGFINDYGLGFRPDVVLMDFDFSKYNNASDGKNLTGVQSIEKMRKTYPLSDTKFIMYSAFQSPETIVSALSAGAVGYIAKNESEAELLEAIFAAKKGVGKLSNSVAKAIMDIFEERAKKSDKIVEDAQLTKREKEVLQYLIQGYKYQEIAKSLYISKDAIDSHVKSIYSKLDVHSQGEAIRKFSNTLLSETKVCPHCLKPIF